MCLQGPVTIPPPILDDEQDLPTQWRLATNSDGSLLLVCEQGSADVTEEPGIASHGRTLHTYSNIRCRVFGMDTSVLAPRPSPWFNIDSLGEYSLFLGLNYPMMVKGDPAVVGTTLPFMRSNCIYTSEVAMLPYAGFRNLSTPDISRFSLDDHSCVGFDVHNCWPYLDFWFKASVSNAEDWLP